MSDALDDALMHARDALAKALPRRAGAVDMVTAELIEALIDAKIDARVPVTVGRAGAGGGEAHVTYLRGLCAKSGRHEYDGCSCTDAELLARDTPSPAQGTPERGEDGLTPDYIDEVAALKGGTGGAFLRRCAGALHTAQAHIAKLKRERDRAREILADTDAASLPKDHSLELTARARIIQMRSAEAEATRLRKAIEGAGDKLDEEFMPSIKIRQAKAILTAALSTPTGPSNA